jgi:hypothetical protein
VVLAVVEMVKYLQTAQLEHQDKVLQVEMVYPILAVAAVVLQKREQMVLLLRLEKAETAVLLQLLEQLYYMALAEAAVALTSQLMVVVVEVALVVELVVQVLG